MPTVSAKNLGQLALPSACPRCFWTKAKMGWKSPWSIFPGVFSSIDGFSKRAILAYHERHGHLPPWVAGGWADATPLDCPHHSKFRMTDQETGITLSGVPDLMLRLVARELAILDLKTARFSDHQDSLAPMYQTQLVGYSLIAESLGMGVVSHIGLIYGEPPPNDADEGLDELVDGEGFRMPFKATALPVELDRAMIPPLLRKAKSLMDMDSPPEGRPGCRDCALVDQLVRLSGRLRAA
jgi:hypothetical protein